MIKLFNQAKDNLMVYDHPGYFVYCHSYNNLMFSDHQKSKPGRDQRLNVNNPGPTAQGFMQLYDHTSLKGVNKTVQHHPALRDVGIVP